MRRASTRARGRVRRRTGDTAFAAAAVNPYMSSSPRPRGLAGSSRRTKRLAAVLVVVAGLVWAATSLGALPRPAAAGGSEGLAACDQDGVSTGFVTEWDDVDGRFEVVSIAVGGIAGPCRGQHLAVAVTGRDGVRLAAASATIAAPSGAPVELRLSPAPSVEQASRVHVAIGRSA